MQSAIEIADTHYGLCVCTNADLDVVGDEPDTVCDRCKALDLIRAVQQDTIRLAINEIAPTIEHHITQATTLRLACARLKSLQADILRR